MGFKRTVTSDALETTGCDSQFAIVFHFVASDAVPASAGGPDELSTGGEDGVSTGGEEEGSAGVEEAELEDEEADPSLAWGDVGPDDGEDDGLPAEGEVGPGAEGGD